MSTKEQFKHITKVATIVSLVLGLTALALNFIAVGVWSESKADRSEVVEVRDGLHRVSERVVAVEIDNESQAEFDERLYNQLLRIESKIDRIAERGD